MQVKSRIAAALALAAATAGMVQADGYAVGVVAGTNGIGLDFTNCAD
jgi:cysteine synthase